MYIHLIDDDDDWDEKRIDIIGQNGNDGIHYKNEESEQDERPLDSDKSSNG